MSLGTDDLLTTSVALALLGGMTSVAVVYIYSLLFKLGRRDFQRDFEVELKLIEKALDAIDSSQTISPKERAELIYLLRMSAVERAGQSRRDWSIIILAVGGILGLLGALFALYARFESYFSKLSVFTAAHAQENAVAPLKTDITWMFPWIAAGLLGVMAVAFIASLITLLFVKDTPENQSRLKAATDVVKTFGGFFTGIATTLLTS